MISSRAESPIFDFSASSPSTGEYESRFPETSSTGLDAPGGMRASAIASGSATATILAISARSYPALSATIAPKEYPAIAPPSLLTPG